MERIAIRVGTSAEWAVVGSTEILAKGEPGYDSTTLTLKIGDGATVWNDLPTAASWNTGATLDNVADTLTRAAVRPADAAALAATNVTGYVTQATTLAQGKVRLVDDGTNDAMVVQNHDSRLSNARAPTAHASSHGTGQSDALSPGSIGAYDKGESDSLVSTHSALTNGVHGITNAGAITALNLLTWNNTDKTIEFPVSDDVTLQIGQEQLIFAVNKTGTNLTNGQVVYVSGAQGQRPTIALAKANASATAIGTIGILTEDIADNGTGMVTVQGIVRGIPIADLAPGDEVYLSAATAGAYTKTKPERPYNIVRIGTCINTTGASSADILVHVHAVQDLQDVGQVALGITKVLANDDYLRYDGTHWRNAVNPATSHIASTSAHGLVAANVAAKPAISGHGLFAQFSAAVGSALSLPATSAETLVYQIICLKSDGTLNLTTPFKAGIAVGGTEIGPAIAGHMWIGSYYML